MGAAGAKAISVQFFLRINTQLDDGDPLHSDQYWFGACTWVIHLADGSMHVGAIFIDE